VPEQGSVYACRLLEIDLGRRELRASGVPAPIGNRAFDILAVLLGAESRLVRRRELLESIWPGVAVGENTLTVHIAALRRALGPDRALLHTDHGRGYRLLGTWTAREEGVTATASGPFQEQQAIATRGSLPISSSALIGRDTTLRRLSDLLSAQRLVTLVGLGGIGKSRLALEVARGLRGDFAGGAWLAELGPLTDPALVPSTVADALGLRFGGAAPTPAEVARAIGGRRLLLVLDNCEHLLGAAAALSDAVVRGCPHATVLATSREALRVKGERVDRVPPLDLPSGLAEAPDRLLGYGAVQLFVERMRKLGWDLQHRPGDLHDIAAACRRLDGIPLAIEFAAARACSLGLQHVLDGLDARFAVLMSGRRTTPQRHRTLRAVLDWSHDLLPEVERRFFRALGVFRGGFTLEAAAAVAGSESTAAEAIASLIEKSLVVIDGTSARLRWRLLETVRAYALEKLAASGDADRTKRSHAEFFRALLSPTAPGVQALTRNQRMALYTCELDNVRAALDWACSPAGDPEAAVAITAAYVIVWIWLALTTECTERVARALDRCDPGSASGARLRMQLLTAFSFVLIYAAERLERVEAALTEALKIARSVDDAASQLVCLWILWNAHSHSGQQRATRPSAKQFLRIARRRGSPADIRVGDRLVGSTLHYAGDQAKARLRLERVLEHHVDPNEKQYPLWFHSNQRIAAHTVLARVLWLQGLPNRAAESTQASLGEAQAKGQELVVQFSLATAACPVALMAGDLVGAERSLAMLIEPGAGESRLFSHLLGSCLKGQLLVRRGEHAAGSALLRTALDARVRAGWTAQHPEFLGTLAEGMAGLGRLAEASGLVSEALAWSARTGELWYAAELYRLKGELALEGTGGRAVEAAEEAFCQALGLAHRQGALAWELRAALSLARLRVRQGRQDDARRLLAPVCGRFTEEGDLADLRAARAILL
jgi:predicted ATPase/DNA-binding winged helix-turn-helix (wHTH) protein